MSFEHSAEESARLFQENWLLYRKLIENNYMFHQELAAEVQAFLHSHFKGQSLSILDLGCGDCSEAVKLFTNFSIRQFVGYDLAEAALNLARINLAPLTNNARLVKADMRLAFQQETPGFDLVFSSYALHHLTSEEKLGFFLGIRNLLSDHGTFVLIDLTRHSGENRGQFVTNYVDGIRQGWAALNPQELQLVSEHVDQNDQPETALEYQRMALEAGLVPIGEGQDHTWHKVQFFGFSKTC